MESFLIRGISLYSLKNICHFHQLVYILNHIKGKILYTNLWVRYLKGFKMLLYLLIVKNPKISQADTCPFLRSIPLWEESLTIPDFYNR